MAVIAIRVIFLRLMTGVPPWGMLQRNTRMKSRPGTVNAEFAQEMRNVYNFRGFAPYMGNEIVTLCAAGSG
ncbi:MAG: hypothetical protein AB7K86_03210 [Rhodospirillales bacterium]